MLHREFPDWSVAFSVRSHRKSGWVMRGNRLHDQLNLEVGAFRYPAEGMEWHRLNVLKIDMAATIESINIMLATMPTMIDWLVTLDEIPENLLCRVS